MNKIIELAVAGSKRLFFYCRKKLTVYFKLFCSHFYSEKWKARKALFWNVPTFKAFIKIRFYMIFFGLRNNEQGETFLWRSTPSNMHSDLKSSWKVSVLWRAFVFFSGRIVMNMNHILQPVSNIFTLKEQLFIKLNYSANLNWTLILIFLPSSVFQAVFTLS